MNFKDILNLPDTAAVELVEGTVKGVYGRKQTDKQKKAGIMPQDVVLIDDSGDQIRLCILNESMHLPEDAKGRIFRFECTPNEKGKPSGIFVNEYNGNKTLQVMRDAVISGDRAKPPVKQEVRQVADAPLPMEVPARRYADIKDHVAAICEMVRLVDNEMSETEIAKSPDYSDFLVRLATTVYIQASKENLIKPSKPVPAAIVQMTRAELPAGMLPEEAPELTNARVSTEYIVNKAIALKLEPEEVDHINGLGGYNWESIYDAFEAGLLKAGHKKEHIHAVYDSLKAQYMSRNKSFSNKEFCLVVMKSTASFLEEVNFKATEVPKEKTVYRAPATEVKVDEEFEIPF